MSDAGKNLTKARAIITSACNVLEHARQNASTFGREVYASNADCYVLLHDASRLFCQYASQLHGEVENKRWSPALPELLLSHPERCKETLALLERKDFTEVSYFQFVAA